MAGRSLEVRGLQARFLRDTRNHHWPNFFAVVKGERVISPTLAFEDAMGATAVLFIPADAEKRLKELARLDGRPVAQA